MLVLSCACLRPPVTCSSSPLLQHESRRFPCVLHYPKPAEYEEHTRNSTTVVSVKLVLCAVSENYSAIIMASSTSPQRISEYRRNSAPIVDASRERCQLSQLSFWLFLPSDEVWDPVSCTLVYNSRQIRSLMAGVSQNSISSRFETLARTPPYPRLKGACQGLPPGSR
ncbi:hypothetical protein BDV95DRAFT_332935 [Massariosphaeria phaeospora]|uniref:Uncharacterized protein n=1 Tax=Massariosphaeria phaeospora TaxID=100035 RepID=A0A7C8MG08_9PLEO|nr:hypothetical protein BDV95DRAFT_332935 [Massariosphaeria phaeospora]